jgi:hypothetical protein
MERLAWAFAVTSQLDGFPVKGQRRVNMEIKCAFDILRKRVMMLDLRTWTNT